MAKATPIYEKRDPLSGDALCVELDAGRLILSTTVDGRPKRVFVIVDAAREGLALAESLHRALTLHTGRVRAPRTVRLS